MPAKPRFVFDTSAIISAALLKHSVSRRAFDKALDEGKLLVSAGTIDELNQVLGRADFAKYVTEDERMEFLAVLLREATLVEVAVHIGVCRDPRDNKFLELAVSGEAVCIVSGDQDLLVLHPFRGISIVTPRGFLDEVWKEQKNLHS
ncbi:MAG: putative toxin-antitoxin system toxin component, PIN family [Chloroflexi bacterium]|nr:putative toxin-antitoxin system toxin component, PIN family [Chloroflexota bacterium]